MNRVLYGSLLVAMVSLHVSAGELPSVGIVYNTKEASSITYKCTPIAGQKLDCTFIQTSVRKKKSPKELANALESARQEFRSGKITFSASDCQSYIEVKDVLEGRKKAPLPEGMAKLSSMEKRDLLGMFGAMIDVCSSRTEENYLKVARQVNSKDARTCLVSSNTFNQTFTRIGSGTENDSWVTESRPEGVCGLVQLSRFTPERDAGINYTFWKYIAKKAITNPNALAFPAINNELKCSQLDEGEYIYATSDKSNPMQCDYVEFSVF